ncbi:aspartate-semialdehyde dehydrogenase [Chloropicon primus]|nr:aspartate-semialdehyde dehydrogenase [Chloropicon primus]|mmetsp:Transcript_31426/g.67844  ORF Transcript_31426/g.67844 Transcript_31426/m.67844 type:complete len:422 (-) Transcript_31426:695-1960(-)
MRAKVVRTRGSVGGARTSRIKTNTNTNVNRNRHVMHRGRRDAAGDSSSCSNKPRQNQCRAARRGGGAERRRASCVAMAGAEEPRVAIVGATGAVGQEFLELLDQRDFPMGSLKLLASARSAGKAMTFKGQEITVEELTDKSFEDVDIALFSAGGGISKKFGPIASDSGAVVVDNSSAFRMAPDVPLVIPEINAEAMKDIKWRERKGGIIANPNCSTIIALMAVTPLHRAATVKRMVVSTYQAASGAGQAAMDELVLQTKEALEGKEVTKDIFPIQYAFNLFSHNSPMQSNGYNEEELKMVKETKKIWSFDDVSITATCIRVPIIRAHAESINLEFEEPLSEAKATELLGGAPGVSLIDNREENTFPTPLEASFKDDVFVGRIRKDISREDERGLDLFVCGDQIRKGAALNAVQIAELLLEQ